MHNTYIAYKSFAFSETIAKTHDMLSGNTLEVFAIEEWLQDLANPDILSSLSE